MNNLKFGNLLLFLAILGCSRLSGNLERSCFRTILTYTVQRNCPGGSRPGEQGEPAPQTRRSRKTRSTGPVRQRLRPGQARHRERRDRRRTRAGARGPRCQPNRAPAPPAGSSAGQVPADPSMPPRGAIKCLSGRGIVGSDLQAHVVGEEIPFILEFHGAMQDGHTIYFLPDQGAVPRGEVVASSVPRAAVPIPAFAEAVPASQEGGVGACAKRRSRQPRHLVCLPTGVQATAPMLP